MAEANTPPNVAKLMMSTAPAANAVSRSIHSMVLSPDAGALTSRRIDFVPLLAQLIEQAAGFEQQIHVHHHQSDARPLQILLDGPEPRSANARDEIGGTYPRVECRAARVDF